MKKQNKRTDILDIGTELISTNGFNATGIDSVLKKAGVPKGSFYYYFGSKEDFGFAIIDKFAEEYDLKLTSYFGDTSVSPLQRMRNYMEHTIEHLAENKCKRGCLIGNLGQELADQNERFRARLESIFHSWQNVFSSCLKDAQEQGEIAQGIDCDVMAEFILSGWEGAILRAKVMQSPHSLRIFIDTLFSSILVR